MEAEGFLLTGGAGYKTNALNNLLCGNKKLAFVVKTQDALSFKK
jgi:hypothetical protein